MSVKRLDWAKAPNPFDKLKMPGSEFGEMDDMPTIMRMTAIETPVGTVEDLEDILLADDRIWTALTNFVLTEEDMYSVEAVPGVEGLRPLTQYRFQVAVGPMFNEQTVKDKIEKILCEDKTEEMFRLLRATRKANPKITKDLQQKIDRQIESIQEKYWALYMLPNGEIKVLTTNDLDTDFADSLAVFYSAFLFVGGYFTSNIGV